MTPGLCVVGTDDKEVSARHDMIKIIRQHFMEASYEKISFRRIEETNLRLSMERLHKRRNLKEADMCMQCI
jgi:hypothetical protein